MCTVSMIGDHYDDLWRRQWPKTYPNISVDTVSRQEFETLKRQVEEMRELLRRAKKYDEDNGEPDCEIAGKMELLRKMAELVGLDIDDLIGDDK